MDERIVPGADMEPIEPTWWHRFATALQFLTRLPVLLPARYPAEYYSLAFRLSLIFFPLVGGLVGLSTALVFVGSLALGLTPLVAAFMAVGYEAFLTGGLHEDAFADTWDALGGGWTREQVLNILTDSRLGTYGVLALVIGVGIRVAVMAAIAREGYLATLISIIAASSLARIAILVIMATTSPVANRVSKTNELSDRQSFYNVWVGTLLSVPFWTPWMISDFPVACVSLVVTSATLASLRSIIVRRAGGTTGDFLGCSAYLTQLIILIGASVR